MAKLLEPKNKKSKLELEGSEPVIAILQTLASQTMALSMRTHEAHWNVKGPNFGPLHELFGDFYDFTNDWVDTMAERVVQQGGVAQALSFPWEPRPVIGDETTLLTEIAMMANALVQQSHVATVELNEATQDESSKDMLIEFTRELEKWVWKIESHLQGYQKVAKKAAVDPSVYKQIAEEAAQLECECDWPSTGKVWCLGCKARKALGYPADTISTE
jgi:starvation-inducible DNA-binding protein